MTLDLRNLRCAVSAAETGSFRRAADALDLPQSSVSRRIQLLERRLGFPLFERSHAGVALTDAGKAFLENALAAARQLDTAARNAVAVHRGHCGELSLGISQTSDPLREALSHFRASFPDVRISLTEGSSPEIRHAVAMGTLDMAFVLGDHDVPGCETRLLWREPAYAALPIAHHLAGNANISWGDVDGETFLAPRHGPASDIQVCLASRLGGAGRQLSIEIHDVSEAGIFDLVVMGYGITMTSGSIARREMAGLIFRPFAGEASALATSALWWAGSAHPAVSNIIAIAEAIGRGEAPPASLRSDNCRSYA
ncbi:MAG: LysR family transcriptional regulator [Sphingomonas paucimobilis]